MAKTKQKKKKQCQKYRGFGNPALCDCAGGDHCDVDRSAAVGDRRSISDNDYTVFVWNVLRSRLRDVFTRGLAVLFGQRFPVFSVKTLIAVAAVFIAMILWSAIPQDPQLSGFRVFSDYLSHTGEHFSSPTTVAAQGGVLGALLYSLSSLLFARTGTVLVIFALLALAALLMIKTEVYVSMWHSITGALHHEKKPKTKRSPRPMEIEELEESGESRRVIGSVELGKRRKNQFS